MFLLNAVISVLSLTPFSSQGALQKKLVKEVAYKLEQVLQITEVNKKRDGLSILLKKSVLDIPLLDLDAQNTMLINRIIRKLLAYNYWGTQCVLNDLPDTLGTLKAEELFNIFYINAFKQTDRWTCGYWALFNAYAVYSLVLEGRELSNEAINLRAQKCFEEYPTVEGCINYLTPIATGTLNTLQPGDTTEMEHLQTLVSMTNRQGNKVFGDLADTLMFMGINHENGIYIDPTGKEGQAFFPGSSDEQTLDPLDLQEALKGFIQAHFMENYVIPNKRGVLPLSVI
ncbi:hypothetical protein H0W26_01635 [Candidatus Dependentiae bacterium]|nr:hypothetical protein [Candidatus Dependentiae bacterium]